MDGARWTVLAAGALCGALLMGVAVDAGAKEKRGRREASPRPDASPSAGPAASGAPADALLRFVHASRGVAELDVLVGGEPLVEGLAFGDVSPYREVPAGEARVQVVMTTGSDGSGTPLIDEAVTLEGGTFATMAVTGAPASLGTLVLSDEPAPMADAAQLRVVQLAADAPAVDVALDGGDVLASDLAFHAATEYLSLPPGEYDLDLVGAGTGEVTFDIEPLVLDPGASVSAFAIGTLSDGSFRVVHAVDSVTEPEVPTALLRFLNASPDAPALDLWAAGEPVALGVAFRDASGYVEVPAGEVSVQVAEAGVDPDTGGAFVDDALVLAEGTRTTLAVADDLASIEPRVFTDAPAPAGDAARVRIVHLSAQGPVIDVKPDGKRRALVADLAYPFASGYLVVAPGELDLEIHRADRKRTAHDADPITLAPGSSSSIFAVGSLSEGTFTLVSTVDVVADADADAEAEAMADAEASSPAPGGE